MNKPKTIGIFVEHQRAWGRLFCEGLASVLHRTDALRLRFLTRDDLASGHPLGEFAGFVARIPDAETARRFARTERPVADISCERFQRKNFFPAVNQDNVAIGELAVRHFTERNFTSLAFCGFNGIRFSDLRRQGFEQVAAKYRLPCAVYPTPPPISADFHTRGIWSEQMTDGADAQELRLWLESLPKPVAVFCANDLRAYHLLSACERAGIRVPDEAAVLGVDDDSLICNFNDPTLSSIDPDATAIGRAAAEALLSALRGNRPSVRAVPVRGLVARGSTDAFLFDPPWLAEALLYIRQHAAEPIGASDIYRMLGRSHTAVDLAFRKVLKTTPVAEIRRIRLTLAADLLKETTLPVAEVARKTGFASAQYFCNTFSAHYKCAPLAYRQSR